MGGPGHRLGGLGCKRTEIETGCWGQDRHMQRHRRPGPGCGGSGKGHNQTRIQGLRGPGSAPGEPQHRASGPGHGELGQGHRGTGTSIETWSTQDTGDQDRNRVLRQGHRRPGPRAGDEEQETGNRTCVEGPGQEHRRLGPGQGHWYHAMGDRDVDTGDNGGLGQVHEGHGGTLRHH